jgi:hypothetical protein
MTGKAESGGAVEETRLEVGLREEKQKLPEIDQ